MRSCDWGGSGCWRRGSDCRGGRRVIAEHAQLLLDAEQLAVLKIEVIAQLAQFDPGHDRKDDQGEKEVEAEEDEEEFHGGLIAGRA